MTSFPTTVCPECDEQFAYRIHVCRECGNESLERQRISGEGSVYARTTIRVAGTDHEEETPFEICVIDVGDEQQVRVTARVRDNPKLWAGDRVVFDEEVDGVFYFREASQ